MEDTRIADQDMFIRADERAHRDGWFTTLQ